MFFIFIICTTSVFADQLIIEPEMGRAPILNAINNTRYSLHLVMYGFTDDAILNALINQHDRGKNVQIILEEAPYKAGKENVKAINAFTKHGLNWQGTIPSIRLIHQKTLVIDADKALVMTFNFTNSTFKQTRNFALVLEDPRLVREIEEHFSADWNHQVSLSHHPSLIWSPGESRRKIIALINHAKQSISIYAQQLNDYKIVGALANAAKGGVQIDVLTSRKLNDKQAAYLQQRGVNIRYSKDLYIHAKAFIIDQQTAIIGSTNLTRASLDDNRELSVITQDKNIIKPLSETFEKDWQNANANTQQPSLLKNKRVLLHAIKMFDRYLSLLIDG